MNAAKKPVCLDSVVIGNWNKNAGPVTLLNPDSTVHERIAYCWSQIGMLSTFLDAMSNHTEDEIRSFSEMVRHFTDPVIMVLEVLGDMTQPSESETI
ncbi:MAG: hypothetical protein IPH35_13660 [Rhodoferax sp.]|nr:hypothetical protein [Rhodoferax sp.]